MSYNGNMAINAPDLSDYNLMNAREKLQAELDAGLYVRMIFIPGSLRMDYAERLERVKKGGKHVLVVSTFACCSRT